MTPRQQRKRLEESLRLNREWLTRQAVVTPEARHVVKLTGPARRAALYNERFPGRPPLVYGQGMVAGTWMIGSCYKNPNPLYGAYPHGYLERVHAMFPDARNILHVFSGGLTAENALSHVGLLPGHEPGGGRVSPKVTLVDMHGPDKGRHPTWKGDLHDYCDQPGAADRHDLVLADPPYSAADSITYDCKMVNRAKVMRSLHRVTKPGGNLVWLDQVWPMHRKDMWKTWGTIGLVRSTNHRVRMVSCFEAQ
jgi:hypothetical protein